MERLSVLVVGAGVVGLSAAFHLLQAGVEVTILDRDPEGDKASFGNAGGIAVTEVVPASAPGVLWRAPGWLLDPLGPLSVRPAHTLRLLPWLLRFAQAGRASEIERLSVALAALNSRVYDDLLPMLDVAGLSGELIRRGALTVYESEAGFRRDAGEWALKRLHGVEIEELSAEAARDMEPALGPIVRRGVFTPQWSHVGDPRRLVVGLRRHVLSRGVEIIAGEVTRLGFPAEVELAGGRRLHGDRVIVATGAWSGHLARSLGDPVSIESERGYNTTFTAPSVELSREIIFAERKFVATPLDCGLRIGGAAEFGGLEAKANYLRSRALATLARRYLPGLRTEGGTVWAGHRPTTPDSLPVIGPSAASPNVIYAFGHGHLGLTQAATTGRLVADLVFHRPPPIDMKPYSIARFR